MIETDLLKKYIIGEASQQEKEAVQLWLEADKANMKEFMAMRNLYDITLANLEEPHEKREHKRVKNIKKHIFRELLKIAAVIIVTVGLSYTVFSKPGMEKDRSIMHSLHVPAGQRAELTLADGTVVWLNAQTTFTFPNRFDNKVREVFLDGEGYFKVARNASHKFIVNTQHYNVNVLGTEFNVSAYNRLNNFEISLLEGSVEVASKNNEEKKQMIPGEHIYMENHTLITDSITHRDYFLWKDGIISFENERIGDILNKLCIIYDVNIQHYNQPLMDVRLNVKFHTKDGAEHALNVLKIFSGLQLKKDEEKNLITVW